ncbi:MAG TPA: peptide chain release factor N(5)-glutamine methyltransferase [Bacteroidia bacterium]|jgi:release factor glutamine methyltransferase
MKIPSNKIKDIIRFFKDELGSLYEASELETIMRYCIEDFTGQKIPGLKSDPGFTVSESQLLKFSFALKDLKNQRPLQYILGKADFYGLKFIVNENVLIPRPETEELVHLIITETKKNYNGRPVAILDIGTGSGCIPVTLKKHLPHAEIFAMDISEKALEVAGMNADSNGCRINYIHDDILDPKDLPVQRYDIIVSNPPYIKLSEKARMEDNVLKHEPHLALFVEDDDALLFYRKIMEFALGNLEEGGLIYFEINAALASESKAVMIGAGFKNVELVKDMSNKNRILRGML